MLNRHEALIKEFLGTKTLVWISENKEYKNETVINEDNSLTVSEFSKVIDGEGYKLTDRNTSDPKDTTIVDIRGNDTIHGILTKGIVMLIHTLNAGDNFNGTVTVRD